MIDYSHLVTEVTESRDTVHDNFMMGQALSSAIPKSRRR